MNLVTASKIKRYRIDIHKPTDGEYRKILQRCSLFFSYNLLQPRHEIWIPTTLSWPLCISVLLLPIIKTSPQISFTLLLAQHSLWYHQTNLIIKKLTDEIATKLVFLIAFICLFCLDVQSLSEGSEFVELIEDTHTDSCK